MPASRLLLRAGLRHMARRRWQTALTFVGVMLGVAMVVAVDLANNSARRAFEWSLDAVAGPVTHQIHGGPEGIPESVYTRLRTERDLRQSAPLMIGRAAVRGEPFTLLGVDPFSEAALRRHTSVLQPRDRSGGAPADLILKNNAAVLSARDAERLGLEAGETFTADIEGRALPVFLAAVYTADNPAAAEGLLLADIAVAQYLLGRYGHLDRIDLVLDERRAGELERWLPAGLTLVESERRAGNLRRMAEAFHTNLTAMSLLALCVAALLIYNTMTLSVLQRRRTLGMYRSLGVSRGRIFALVLGEAGVLAALAGAAGVVAGLLLGRYLVTLVTQTVHEMYFYLHVTRFLVEPASLLKGFVFGVGAALIAAALPAREATHSAPVSVQQRSVLEQRRHRFMPLLFLAGAAFVLSGFILGGADHGSLVGGFAALGLIVAGFCLAVPYCVVWLTRAAAVLLPRSGTTARMALRGVYAGISRTGPAVAALTLAVSVTVGVETMIGSFRHTLQAWLNQSLDGDVYVSHAGGNGSRGEPALPPELVERLRHLPDAAAARASLSTRVETGFGPLRLLALEPRPADHNMPLKSAVEDAGALFQRGEGVLVSEPLAYHHRLEPGDRIELHTSGGPREMPVLGVFYDYTSSRGRITMALSAYRRLWNDDRVSGLVLYRAADVSQSELLETARAALAAAPEPVRVRSNREIRQESLAIFDRTFAVTRVLRLLAVVVAFVGILSALIALQLERAREFAVLRATGMTPRQTGALVLGQTGLMGLLSGLLAVPLGLAMAWMLIEVINRRSFGWSLQPAISGGAIVEALVLAVAAALVAGIYPAWKAGSASIAEALREE